jgi:hypothetical protein
VEGSGCDLTEALTQHFCAGAEEDNVEPWLGYPIFGPKFETATSRIRNVCARQLSLVSVVFILVPRLHGTFNTS